jgi:hypothetical protein
MERCRRQRQKAGKPVNTPGELNQLIRSIKPGDKIEMEVKRPTGLWKTNILVTGYKQPVVQITQLYKVTGKQMRLRDQWAAGN